MPLRVIYTGNGTAMTVPVPAGFDSSLHTLLISSASTLPTYTVTGGNITFDAPVPSGLSFVVEVLTNPVKLTNFTDNNPPRAVFLNRQASQNLSRANEAHSRLDEIALTRRWGANLDPAYEFGGNFDAKGLSVYNLAESTIPHAAIRVDAATLLAQTAQDDANDYTDNEISTLAGTVATNLANGLASTLSTANAFTTSSVGALDTSLRAWVTAGYHPKGGNTSLGFVATSVNVTSGNTEAIQTKGIAVYDSGFPTSSTNRVRLNYYRYVSEFQTKGSLVITHSDGSLAPVIGAMSETSTPNNLTTKAYTDNLYAINANNITSLTGRVTVLEGNWAGFDSQVGIVNTQVVNAQQYAADAALHAGNAYLSGTAAVQYYNDVVLELTSATATVTTLVNQATSQAAAAAGYANTAQSHANQAGTYASNAGASATLANNRATDAETAKTSTETVAAEIHARLTQAQVYLEEGRDIRSDLSVFRQDCLLAVTQSNQHATHAYLSATVTVDLSNAAQVSRDNAEIARSQAEGFKDESESLRDQVQILVDGLAGDTPAILAAVSTCTTAATTATTQAGIATAQATSATNSANSANTSATQAASSLASTISAAQPVLDALAAYQSDLAPEIYQLQASLYALHTAMAYELSQVTP